MTFIDTLFHEYAEALLNDISHTFDVPLHELYEYYDLKAVGAEGGGRGKGRGMGAAQAEEYQLLHTHLPVRWLVAGCACCERFGNVLDGKTFSNE